MTKRKGSKPRGGHDPSRRNFIRNLTIGGITVAGVGAIVYLERGSLFAGKVMSSTATSSTSSFTSTSASSIYTDISSGLAAVGMNTRAACAYGDPLFGTGIGNFSSFQAALAYYISQQFRVYPIEDASNGFLSNYTTLVSMIKAAGGAVFGPSYGYGYADVFFDPATGQADAITQWPSEQVWNFAPEGSQIANALASSGVTSISVWIDTYFAVGQTITINPGKSPTETAVITAINPTGGTSDDGTVALLTLQSPLANSYNKGVQVIPGTTIQNILIPSTANDVNCVSWDSPELIVAFAVLYNLFYKNAGKQALLGNSDWPSSDHPINNAGAQGANGEHNMRVYDRYVNNPQGLPINYYLQDVNASGNHNTDGTACKLWSLRGLPDTFSGATTVSLDSNGNVIAGSGIMPTVAMAQDITTYHRTSSFIPYYQAAQGWLEYNGMYLPSFNQNGGFAIVRSSPFLQLVPAYSKAMNEGYLLASIYSAPVPQTDTMFTVPYMNLANSDDNGSNPGRSTDYEVATPATITYFWTTTVPALGNAPWVEADTDPSQIQTVIAGSSWTQYANAYAGLSTSGLIMEPVIDDSLIINVIGAPDRKQLWVSNTSDVSRRLRFNLDSGRFGIKNPEYVEDTFSKKVIYSGAKDIEIKADVQKNGWMVLNLPSLQVKQV